MNEIMKRIIQLQDRLIDEIDKSKWADGKDKNPHYLGYLRGGIRELKKLIKE